MAAVQAGTQREEALAQLADAQTSAQAAQQRQAGLEADLAAAQTEATTAAAERDSLAEQLQQSQDQQLQVRHLSMQGRSCTHHTLKRAL